jgi:hypothetical protein
MKNIVTCLSAKDLITYSIQSKVYRNEGIKIFLIGSSFTLKIIKIVNIIQKKQLNIEYINEKLLLKESGINDIKKLIILYNPKLLKKANWYKQQFLKFEARRIIKDDYIIIDGDTFPTKVETILNFAGNIRFVNTYTPIHYPYESLYNYLFDKEGISNLNYVCEVFQINFNLLNNLVFDIENKHNNFWCIVVLQNANHLIGFSEYQTYARYELDSSIIKDYIIFNTDRNFGKKQLPFIDAKNCDTDFFSFETYDYPSGFNKIIFYVLIKPYVKISQLLKL